MQKIGFANKFYTLWDVVITPNYFTDHIGNHHYTGDTVKFYYVKNISTDLDKVKSLHPGLIIDEELRGMTRNWEKQTPDLTPELIKFGKHSGFTLQEIAEKDMSYIFWLIDNCYNAQTRELCKQLPLVVEHLSNEERERKEAMEKHPVVNDGYNELTFTCNPNHRIEFDASEWYFYTFAEIIRMDLPETCKGKYYAAASIGEGNRILVVLDEVKPVSGMYPYNMGVINGKAMKLKNKKVKVNLTVLATERYQTYALQIVKINSK